MEEFLKNDKKYTVRHAKVSDFDTIFAIEKEGFPEAERASEQAMMERLQTFPECFYLLEVDGKLVAMIDGMRSKKERLEDSMYATTKDYSNGGAWFLVFGVETFSEYRGQGWMRILMEYVQQDLRQKGLKGIFLSCKEKMIPFYEGFGFRYEGVADSEHGGVVWYEMRLEF